MSRTTSFEIKKELESLSLERKSVIDQLAKVRRGIFDIIHKERNSIILNGEEISPSDAAAFVVDHAEDLSFIPGKLTLYSPLPLTKEQLIILYKSNEKVTLTDEEELKYMIPSPGDILSPEDFDQVCNTLLTSKHKIESIEEEHNCEVHFNIEEKTIQIAGEFGETSVLLPDYTAIENLKNHLGSFGKIEKWMKCAAVDGKNGGAYRARWRHHPACSRVQARTESSDGHPHCVPILWS